MLIIVIVIIYNNLLPVIALIRSRCMLSSSYYICELYAKYSASIATI